MKIMGYRLTQPDVCEILQQVLTWLDDTQYPFKLNTTGLELIKVVDKATQWTRVAVEITTIGDDEDAYRALRRFSNDVLTHMQVMKLHWPGFIANFVLDEINTADFVRIHVPNGRESEHTRFYMTNIRYKLRQRRKT